LSKSAGRRFDQINSGFYQMMPADPAQGVGLFVLMILQISEARISKRKNTGL